MTTALPGSKSVAPVLVGTIWDELVAGLRVGVLLHDGSGAVLAANLRAGELLGIRQPDLLNGFRPDGWEICDDSGAPLPQIAHLFAQVRNAGMPATGPFVITLNGQPCRRLWAEVHPVPLRGEQLMVIVLHPVQADVRQSEGLLDPLTGLPNRTLLFDRLEQALTRARTHGTMVSIVLTDIRGLAEINQVCGFDQGDQLLTVISERLRAELRADHTIARYAGGTFAVVAEHPHGTGEPIANRITAIAQVRVGLATGVTHPRMHTSWATSEGNCSVHELLGLAQARLRTG